MCRNPPSNKKKVGFFGGKAGGGFFLDFWGWPGVHPMQISTDLAVENGEFLICWWFFLGGGWMGWRGICLLRMF